MGDIIKYFGVHFSGAWEIIYLITTIAIIIVVIMDNRNPSKTLAWVMALILMPIVGIVLYFFMGQNYRRKKMFSRKGLQDQNRLEIMSLLQLHEIPQIDNTLLPAELQEKSDIIHLLLKNNNALLTTNHKIKILNNGKATFDSVIEALENAKEYIHLEYYILTLDKIGTRIFNILKRKAAEGVDVKVIYDSVGSMGMKWAKKAEIRATGIQFECFLRIYFPILSSRSNYRNHRKIVVVDGKVGFTGGINIADNYVEETKRFGVWRDTFVRIEGNAVYALDAIFCADWYFITKEKITANMESYLENPSDGNFTQIISGCPDSDWKVILQFYFSAISTAKKSVYITTPYFIPNDEVICAIKMAGLRGLDVRLLLPEITDSRITKWCSESFLGELLLAGLKIYKYKPGFVHSKVVIVDGILSSVGTANMDYRSLETNFEVNAVFYDTQIAKDLTDSFLEDLKHSTLLTYEIWKNRPWYYKLVSSASRLFAPAM